MTDSEFTLLIDSLHKQNAIEGLQYQVEQLQELISIEPRLINIQRLNYSRKMLEDLTGDVKLRINVQKILEENS